MKQLDVQRRLAIAELLTQPDPPELRRRGHRLRLDGKPERYALLPLLVATFVQTKLLALHGRRRDAAAVTTEHQDIRWVHPARRREAPIAA